MTANNVIRISTSLNGNFFKHWFAFLEPFHKLTEKEASVVASFLKNRYELSKLVKDEDILNSLIFSKETKEKIRKECDITNAYFQVILSKLRKNKIVVDNKINPRFIPHIEEGKDSFNLVIKFELNEV